MNNTVHFYMFLLLTLGIPTLTQAAQPNTLAHKISKLQCANFQVQSQKILQETPVRLVELSFPACNGGRILAYWVGPTTPPAQLQPAILFVHWYDPTAADSNREEFLAEAKTLAAQGVASLLVTTFWTEPNAPYHQRRWQDDYTNTLNQTQDLLRALTWMRQQPNIDTRRIAYVGHDYGAGFGALVAELDPKIKAFVLMATPADLTDWYLYGSATGKPEGADLKRFKKSFQTVNPARSLAKSHAQILLQFSNNDPYVSPMQAQQLIKAAPSAQVHFYAVGHDMKIEQAKSDRLKFLQTILQLKRQTP